jgi:hypothetical protein
MIIQYSVDFHCHTNAFKDSRITPEMVFRADHRCGLDRLMITDHNTIAGALEAYASDPELVIVGEEIMTTRGEILAFYVSREIPSGLSPQETINCLRDQGAFISVSHPFDTWRSGSWNMEHLVEIISQVDSVEVFTARCMVPHGNLRASQFAQKYDIAGTAGSDAHAAFEIGTARLELPTFASPEELRAVIKNGKVGDRRSLLWIHLFSRYASLRKKVV